MTSGEKAMPVNLLWELPDRHFYMLVSASFCSTAFSAGGHPLERMAAIIMLYKSS